MTAPDLAPDTATVESRLAAIEQQLAAIQERNLRVESDKAWETSLARVLAICALTYLLMCLTFYLIEVERWALNAFVPTLGFYLSTRTLRLIRSLVPPPK